MIGDCSFLNGHSRNEPIVSPHIQEDDRQVKRANGITSTSILGKPVVIQPGLCRALSETPKAGFLATQLIS